MGVASHDFFFVHSLAQALQGFAPRQDRQDVPSSHAMRDRDGLGQLGADQLKPESGQP
jgi:hypothetical protein